MAQAKKRRTKVKRVIMRLSWLAALALVLSLASLPATHSPAYAYENTKDGLNSSGAVSPEPDEFADLDKIDISDLLPPAKAFVVTTRIKMNVSFSQFNSCTGENVLFQGTVLDIFHSTLDGQGGAHVIEVFRLKVV